MTRMREAAPHPCAGCPWLIRNQGVSHPDHWYDDVNLRRLWQGLRHGRIMSCHPTDTSVEVPAGTKPVDESAVLRECAGSLILKQREFARFRALAIDSEEPDPMGAYRRLHPGGLTFRALAKLVERCVYGQLGGVPMSAPDLNQADLGAPDVRPWTPDEESLSIVINE